jgi:DNA replication and repair protein RecF
MALKIVNISLKNFRNYEEFSLENPSKKVLFVGENAVGKTNIIEALQLLSSTESFRRSHTEEIIKDKESKAKISIDYEQEDRVINIEMQINEGKRSYYLNKKSVNRRNIVGLLPSVLFTPDDIGIIKGSSAGKRELIDDLGSQISCSYKSLKEDYERIIKQKNFLLKEEKINRLMIDSWNSNQAKLGAALFYHRLRLFNLLKKRTKEIYENLKKEEILKFEYIPSWKEKEEEEFGNKEKEELEKEIYKKLEENLEKEISNHGTIIGPHRDSIKIYINDKDVRRFASQGQQRSIALAIKLAELNILRELLKVEPILLLDDVMSELDEKRRELLLENIGRETQTFITTTNKNYFKKEFLDSAQVIKLIKKD